MEINRESLPCCKNERCCKESKILTSKVLGKVKVRTSKTALHVHVQYLCEYQYGCVTRMSEEKVVKKVCQSRTRGVSATGRPHSYDLGRHN